METDKHYLTKAKYQALNEEIKYLEKGEGSRLLAQLLASSPGSGMGRPNDLPAHVMAGELMGYLQDIKAIIHNAVIIDDLRDQIDEAHEINIGDTVSVQYAGEDEFEQYTILGPKEVDLSLGRISCHSPMGAALLGKRKGEVVAFQPPNASREVEMRVVDIRRLPLNFTYGVSIWKDKLERALMMENKASSR
jgi:transcription elongation GreA/GreB family factor